MTGHQGAGLPINRFAGGYWKGNVGRKCQHCSARWREDIFGYSHMPDCRILVGRRRRLSHQEQDAMDRSLRTAMVTPQFCNLHDQLEPCTACTTWGERKWEDRMVWEDR